jgi:hypothetical protein
VVENKVASPLRMKQLERQRGALAGRFQNVHVLAVTARELSKRPPKEIHHKRWSDIYRWAREQARESGWARRLAEYLEAAEARMIEKDYLKEGTLTEFAGVPFGREEPYNYLEAKRVLKLAMKALRRRTDLKREFDIDPEAEGRPAITGRESRGVWDFIPLPAAEEEKKKEGSFTEFPHLTLGIGGEQALAILVLPNGMRSECRRRLLELGRDGFVELVLGVVSRMEKSLSRARGFVPWLQLFQRRYPTPRSLPIVDARLEFDLRTALPAGGGKGESEVRPQREWLDSAFDVFGNKRSNMSMEIGAAFPYALCEAVGKPEALSYFAAAWIACRPILDVILPKR